MRHGRVASHRGDIPITEQGLAEVEAAGRRLASEIGPDETVSILTTDTRRSRETAEALHRVMQEALGRQLTPPLDEPAIRNPDVYIGGLRVEMVSNAQAMAEQTASIGLGAEQIDRLAFWRDFFPSPDRIGYWVGHRDPPGENAEAVARRVMTWGASLDDLPSDRPRRYVAVTHSPILRAFLVCYLLEADPGEPEFGEWIDLVYPGDGTVTSRYRNFQARRGGG
jgi:broad specificity phosphatase PhoE